MTTYHIRSTQEDDTMVIITDKADRDKASVLHLAHSIEAARRWAIHYLRAPHPAVEHLALQSGMYPDTKKPILARYVIMGNGVIDCTSTATNGITRHRYLLRHT